MKPRMKPKLSKDSERFRGDQAIPSDSEHFREPIKYLRDFKDSEQE